MALALGELIEPATTALLAMELKRVTVGDLAGSDDGAPGSALAAVAADTNLVPRVAALARAARAAGVRVVHCTAGYREDGVGSSTNAPLLAAAYKHRHRLLLGSPGAAPVLELGPEPEDLWSVRTHGVAPFIGTDLDPMLRNLGVRNVVLVGGSVNVGIVGAAVEAVDFGYRVVIPRDGVIGHPVDYAEGVIDNTLALLARISTIDEIVDTWSAARVTILGQEA
ncbi:MAG: isochorismatase family protein [Acidimicrobiales bacterium]|nr:isochorismatase family protein [Acidimicrobiales bacterium]